MKYLITGGAGFIGSHLVDYLIQGGHQILALDNLSTGRLENVEHHIGNKNFELIVDSILNTSMLDHLVEKIDIIVHLAAAVGVKIIMEQPVETIRTNILGTEEVLRAASRYQKKVLIASTSEVYGKLQEQNDDISMLSEEADWILGPTTKRRWAYAASKSIDEFLGLAYHEEKNLPVIIVRFFNTVGPRQIGQYGMVVPRFIKRALLNEPLQVYGDGEQRRCFTYVGDVVRAIVDLLNTPEAEGQVFNLGGIEEITINELAQQVIILTESQSKIVKIPYESAYGQGFEDIRRRIPDISKIQSVIGFKPTKSIKEILALVIDEMKRK
ncbi:MAG: GDP-mannose 4,6-dehydratase [Candidatus Neomarinimicrobiota bacterium]